MIIKGQKINDRYEIIRMIGEGGMANVYLAHDTILDRDVAVKVLRGDLATDEKFVRRFQREAISASSLSHPNIVEMYDVGEDDGKYFIVMEYIEGKTLKNLIKKRGALTLSEVIDIMLQLSSGLACAHDSFIIHRDIKPQNVLIKDDGSVKITDFGIAMALNSNELTQTNSVMGSVHYLPPEQANGSGATIKSDIYSLGILMFELLTGKIPFKGENAVEIAIKQMNEKIPSVRAIRPEIPQSVENIVLKACAKNPKNRYDSAQEMYEDLKTALNPEREDEEIYTYPYSEKDLEQTKKMPNLSRLEKNEEIKEDNKNSNKKKVVTISVIVGVIVVITIGILLMFTMRVPDVEIPDVVNMTEKEATDKLKKLGFVVNIEDKSEYSDNVEEGNIIGTSPKKGKTVKKGSTITLIVSLGQEGFATENYVGQNFLRTKTILEAKKIVVKTEEKEYSEQQIKDDNIDVNNILEQDIEEGTTLKPGDTITFTIVKQIAAYPDFVNGEYTVEDVQKFCDDNNVTLDITYKETNEYPEGSIISQSRNPGVKVASGVTFRITVTKKIPDVELNSITIDGGNQILKVGSQKTLTVTFNPTNVTNKSVTYASSDTKVVTVSNNGVITGVKAGTATITATSNGKSSSIKVTVTDENNDTTDKTTTPKTE